ncbi:sel1 repeat family protein [Pseudoalteromonas sp. ZZD1]|uniref:tetratricopeptide repeat protein n=1 Tax=Pseudoalteromonas sp. ZZD1 TaxID=3139395 RepID=UPI003BAB898E
MVFLIKLIGIVTTLCCFSSSLAFAHDIFKAEEYYTAKNFKLAKASYSEAAKVGNPYAYHRLATMYFKGLGTDKDAFKALIYFSFAAEYDFHDSKSLVEKILSNMPTQERLNIQKFLNKLLSEKGKQYISKKYLPELAANKLANKITFDGKAQLELDDFELDLADNDFLDDSDYEMGDDSEDSLDMDFSFTMTSSEPFVIIDFDLAPDGSVRNIVEVQRDGRATTLLGQFSQYSFAKPTIQHETVEFVARVNLGIASYDKLTLRRKNVQMYQSLLRQSEKLKASSSLTDRFQYAQLLQYFGWLEQYEGEANERLKSLAEEGLPDAMYEYGLKLYREQDDIEQAIDWITQASTYGLAKAESRLGKLLISSPWVHKDETKALFWLESAAKKDDISASLKAAELRLFAQDKALRNFSLALEYLTKIGEQQKWNPEYYYLLSQAYRFGEQRDFQQVIQNLKRAISMGERVNWDIEPWQTLLAQLTIGKVFISEKS